MGKNVVIGSAVVGVFLIALCAVARSVYGAESCPRSANPEQAIQCGHHAILRCCQLLGVPTDLKTLVKLLPSKPSGHSMAELIQVLSGLEIKAAGMLESYDVLCKGTLPVIAHMKIGHFVVVEKVDNEFVTLLDGNGRRKMVTVAQFQMDWDGKLIRVTRAAPQSPAPQCKSAASCPRIQFNTLLIDKGEIPYGEGTVTYSFPFRNLGSADLVVQKVGTSCSCVGSEKPEKPIQPGQVGTIVLKYHPDQQSAFTQTASVQTNDPCVPVIELVAAGNAERRLVVDPPLLNFGDVILGDPKQATIVVRYLGDTPLAIDSVTCNLPGAQLEQHTITEELVRQLRTEKVYMQAQAPGSEVIQVTWTAQGAIGTAISGNMELVTNVKGYERFTIPIKGEIVAPVLMSPSSLFIGEVDRKTKVRQKIMLRSRKSQNFNISEVDLKGSGVVCSYPPSSKAGQTELSFSGKGADMLALSNKKIPIRIETASGQEFELLLSVFALAKP